jgi:hypothetical protein
VTALGEAPFGTARFGGGGQIVIRGAVALTTHEILVDFDKAPQALDSGGYESATNPKNWAIAAVDPTIGTARPPSPVPSYAPTVIGIAYDDDLPTQVLVGTDLPMEMGVAYDLIAQPSMRGADCETLVDERTWRVSSRRRPRVSPVSAALLDRYQDFHTTADGAVITPAGDIGTFGGVEALKMRILRRITTALGGFVALTGYGVNVRLKSVLRPGDAQALANAITRQLALEPDVLQGSAVVRVADAIVEITISVARREGKDVTYLYEFPQVQA